MARTVCDAPHAADDDQLTPFLFEIVELRLQLAVLRLEKLDPIEVSTKFRVQLLHFTFFFFVLVVEVAHGLDRSTRAALSVIGASEAAFDDGSTDNGLISITRRHSGLEI